jgi:hypothetical protein
MRLTVSSSHIEPARIFESEIRYPQAALQFFKAKTILEACLGDDNPNVKHLNADLERLSHKT